MGASYEKQKKAKSKKIDIVGRWTPLPHTVIHSKEYRGLSHTARSLLFDVAAQYNGLNNGKLVACSRYLRPLGWRSNDSIYRALKLLTISGILIQTRQGMRPPCSQAAWFALGWLGLDVTDGLDINAKQYRRSNLTPMEKIAKPPHGVSRALRTPSHGVVKSFSIPTSGAILAINEQTSAPSHGAYIYLPSNQGQVHCKLNEVMH